MLIVSYAMGMTLPGGYGQYVRVPAGWVMKLDDDLDMAEAMAYGTAGLTAALSVQTLLADAGDLTGKRAIVTGATGGLGSMAVAFLSQLGCKVSAVSGKAEAKDFLKSIGATNVLGRSKVDDETGQEMLVPRWDYAIDVVGGNVLATVLKMIKADGLVIATGMIQGTNFNANVLPFILRGIKLAGVNAEATDMAGRKEIWRKMLTDWKPAAFENMYRMISLDELPDELVKAGEAGNIGRVVVDMR